MIFCRKDAKDAKKNSLRIKTHETFAFFAPLRQAILFGRRPMLDFMKKPKMPASHEALPGRTEKMPVPEKHFVNGRALTPPFPAGMEQAQFGLGCFWGAEKYFWQMPGVYVTAVGYAGGHTPNPTYKEVCSGMTGHNEVVLVVYDPKQVSYEKLLKLFWEAHDPTQGMRQGNDVGTQYRSGIYVYKQASFPPITTEILDAPEFYYAEDYHQQYLARNPHGYCGHGGTGVTCPI
jgi:peptide-methionine (S)-S-oxide reductase